MNRVTVGVLHQLGAATETVGDDESGGVGGSDGRQHTVLGAGYRYIVVPLFESEVPGEPTASGVQGGVVDTCCCHESFVGFESEYGVLVAVHLRDRIDVQRTEFDRRAVE